MTCSVFSIDLRILWIGVHFLREGWAVCRVENPPRATTLRDLADVTPVTGVDGLAVPTVPTQLATIGVLANPVVGFLLSDGHG